MLCDSASVAAEGVASGESRKQALDSIRKPAASLFASLRLSEPERKALWAHCVSLVDRVRKGSFAAMRKLRKGSPQPCKADCAQACWLAIRPFVRDNGLLRMANQVAYAYEGRKKTLAVLGPTGAIAKARSPFFLVSSHPHPAEDHADWDGRMLYDADWESKNDWSESDKARIRSLIRNRRLRTVQEATSAPNWVCIRRNCRHRIAEVPLEDALCHSPRSLLRGMGMIDPDSEPKGREVLEYRAWSARLATERALMKGFGCQLLEEDAKKDKKTLDKWKSML